MNRIWMLILMSLSLVSCRDREQVVDVAKEDAKAKEMLQGIWLDEENGDPSFRAEGDTIYYPDSVSMPVYFKIVNDTLILEGSTTVRYPIVKRTAHLFRFVNGRGEEVKLVKSDQADDRDAFDTDTPISLNQRQTIKRDTVLNISQQRYHCYVQVNPSTYKVYKTSYNDDGVAVDNIYYDNSIYLAMFKGTARVYSHEFHKQDFTRLVPQDFLKQSILSDMLFNYSDTAAVHYNAVLAIPDTPGSYIVDVAVGYKGGMKMSIAERQGKSE